MPTFELRGSISPRDLDEHLSEVIHWPRWRGVGAVDVWVDSCGDCIDAIEKLIAATGVRWKRRASLPDD